MNKLQEANILKELERVSKRNPRVDVLALIHRHKAVFLREDSQILTAYIKRGYEIRFAMRDGNLI